MLLCLASYEQCSIQLLTLLNKHCNMDMLGIILIYQHSLLGGACPRDRAYILVKPLAAVLEPINVHMYEHVFQSKLHNFVYTFQLLYNS